MQWRSADYVFAKRLDAGSETVTIIAQLREAERAVIAGAGAPKRRKRRQVKGLYVSQNPRLQITAYQSAPRRRADEAP